MYRQNLYITNTNFHDMIRTLRKAFALFKLLNLQKSVPENHSFMIQFQPSGFQQIEGFNLGKIWTSNSTGIRCGQLDRFHLIADPSHGKEKKAEWLT